MTKTRTRSLDKYWSPVPNNPRDNQLYILKKNRKDEDRFNKDMMLFDKKEQLDKVVEAFRRYSNSNKTLQKVVSKHEPGEPKRTEYLKVDKDKFNKDMEFWKKRNQQSAARERLKRKGAVPTKSGKRLFEDFCREAYKDRKRNERIDKLANDPTLWTGLEGYMMSEDINAFVSHLRRLYYSGERLTFRKWIDKVEYLLDEVS